MGDWGTSFRETSFNTMDPKGRVAIPVRFKEAVRRCGGKLVMTKMEKALNLYSPEAWVDIEARVETMSETSRSMRRFRRHFIGSAVVCDIDNQSRILVSPALRDYAGLKKEIVMVGQLDHFQIWARDRYDADCELAEADIETDELSEQISKLRL